MIKVYHYKKLTSGEAARLNGPDGGWDSEPRFSRYADITMGDADLSVIAKAMLEGEYACVAVVGTNDKEAAYALTNHIESDWTKNDNVVAIPGFDGYKSTSVGDIFEMESGAMYIVANMGFKRIEG